MVTRAFCVNARVPRAPLTLIWSSFIATSTPWGKTTGIFPTRDISVTPQCPLGHIAKHFTTDTGSARLTISHDTLGGRDNGDTQTVHDLGDGAVAFVDAEAGAADALNALNHRASPVILQGDFQLGLAIVGTDGKAIDI